MTDTVGIACQQVWRNSGTQTFEEIKYLCHERFLSTESILNDRLTDHFYKILKSISREDVDIDTYYIEFLLFNAVKSSIWVMILLKVEIQLRVENREVERWL